MHMQASAFHTVVEENVQMLGILPSICKLTNSEPLSESQRRFAMLPRGGTSNSSFVGYFRKKDLIL